MCIRVYKNHPWVFVCFANTATSPKNWHQINFTRDDCFLASPSFAAALTSGYEMLLDAQGCPSCQNDLLLILKDLYYHPLPLCKAVNIFSKVQYNPQTLRCPLPKANHLH
eukprot:TRINITY_DN2012_c0_g2_i1.p1 TRINITY_DN2012_c0_g2~~TRINITY_DN2012_c0_g2_i1.p1  ORF type:complete len:110 (-),score=12.53 TRINITY_DN2012_c0_g2_i1:319-648(-)